MFISLRHIITRHVVLETGVCLSKIKIWAFNITALQDTIRHSVPLTMTSYDQKHSCGALESKGLKSLNVQQIKLETLKHMH